MDDTQIKEMVRARYGGIAAKASEASCCAPAASTCCGPETTSHDKARRMGYSEAELAAAPDGRAPPKGLRLKLRTLTLTTYHSLGVELLATSGLGQRRLTPRNPDLRVTSIDERGAPTPTVRPTTASRLKSSHSGPSVLCIRPRIPARGPASGDYRARPSNASVVWTRPVRRKQSRGLDRARG